MTAPVIDARCLRGAHSHLDWVETRQRLRRAQDAVNAVLDASAFNVAAVEALARRWHYADAAGCLLRIIRCPGHDLIPIFLQSPAFAAYRCAIVFGAIPTQENLAQTFTVDDLRAIGTRAARLALIASGEPVEWTTSDQVERAVYTLRRIVLRMRGC
jgi:hypothetical protein